MKTKLLFAIFIACTSNCYSQNWLWAKSATGTGNVGWSICSDPNGNLFVTGHFSSPTITFGSTTLTNSGTDNVFIVKYDANGNVLWAKSAGGSYSDKGFSVSVDANGNVFVTGQFSSSTINFGSTTLTQTGGGDIFIVKYDMNGNILWAKSAVGASSEAGISVSSDASGNVFVTGESYSPTLAFGSTTITNANGTLFIVKYDANGNVLWAKSPGGTEGHSVSADAGGNVFVAGGFDSPTFTFGSTTLTNAGAGDGFIAKYDANGNALWAKSIGGTSWDVGYSVSVDGNGNVFITGLFSSSTITIGTTVLTNVGSWDGFIAKYDASGNVLWAKSVGGGQQDYGLSISADAGGNVFVVGEFSSSSIIFDSITITPPLGSTFPMFIVKYDANGNALCASALAALLNGGFNTIGVSADPFGNAYIGGPFAANPFIVGADTLPLTGQLNVFVAKYTCSNNVAVNELSNEESVSVYPNPTSGVFVIASPPFGGINSAKQSHIEIYNLLGEKKYQSLICNSQPLIDISDSPNGIYFVHIISENESAVKKIIIQK